MRRLKWALAAALAVGLSTWPGCSEDQASPASYDGGGAAAESEAPAPPPDAAPDAVPPPPPGFGRIEGKVVDFMRNDGAGLAGVKVAASDLSTVSAANGTFRLDVPAGERVLVSVSKATDPASDVAYSSSQIAVRVRDGRTTQLAPKILTGCVARTNQLGDDAGSGPVIVTVQDACPERTGVYASIELEHGGVAKGGSPFSGTVRVEIIPVPIPSQTSGGGRDLSFFSVLPGDMTGVTKEGAETDVEPIGAAEIRLLDDATGDPIQIAAGKKAKVRVQLSRVPAPDEPMGSWSYDLAKGRWVEEAKGSVANVGGFDVFEGTVSHLTWWSAVQSRTKTRGCIRGVARIAGSAAPWGGSVTARGITRPSTSVMSASEADGSFCVDVTGGITLAVDDTYVAPDARAYSLSPPLLVAPPVGHSCKDGVAQCLDLGPLDLQPTTVCASGDFQIDVPNGDPPLNVRSHLPGNDPSIGRPTSVISGAIGPAKGPFCVEVPRGAGYDLLDTTGHFCGTPVSSSLVLTPPDGGITPGTCGGPNSGCGSFGVLGTFDCPPGN